MVVFANHCQEPTELDFLRLIGFLDIEYADLDSIRRIPGR